MLFFRSFNATVLFRMWHLLAKTNLKLAKFPSLDRVMGLLKFLKIQM